MSAVESSRLSVIFVVYVRSVPETGLRSEQFSALTTALAQLVRQI